MSTEIRHEPELMTIPETALELRTSAQTIRRWIRQGRLEAVRLPSGQLRVPISALPRLGRTQPARGHDAMDRGERRPPR